MSLECNFEGCTVGETGVCALERDPNTCEHRLGSSTSPDHDDAREIEEKSEAKDDLGGPVLEKPPGVSSFPSSRTLGPEIVSEMMASRYVKVVGILGDPESGKTSCLTSLYLIVANAMLDGWEFADSRSLMGFEDIARGAREWNKGQVPDQMTVHTEMADDRRPGFLHLRLMRTSDGRRVDFALPDLPGEWTTDLIGTARVDRFEFLKSAEAIWVVIDGRLLADRERRQGVISRLGQLAGRLNTIFDGVPPKVLIVITHRDEVELETGVSARMDAELAKWGLSAKVVQLAAFSANTDIKAGFGIVELIDATVSDARPAPEFWPSSSPSARSRTYLAFRRDQ